MHLAQAQARSLAQSLGGEEGLENLRGQRLVDAGAGADADADADADAGAVLIRASASSLVSIFTGAVPGATSTLTGVFLRASICSSACSSGR